MVRLMKKAQIKLKPAFSSISPKAMPMERYPISTGRVTGKAADSALRSMSRAPFGIFTLT